MIESKNNASRNSEKALQALEQANTHFFIVKRNKGQPTVEKASLPNDLNYELAEEVVRDYVQRNFVDK